MLIQTVTGNETFSGAGTVKVWAFYRKSGEAQEVPAYLAAKDPQSGIRLNGSPDFVQASMVNRNHGEWRNSRYTLPEGSIIRVQIDHLSRGTFGTQKCNVLLRMRDGAGLQKIRIPFTGAEAATQTAGYYEGSFDIVQMGWLDHLHIPYPDDIENYMRDDSDEYFTHETVEAALRVFAPAAKQEVKTVSGRVAVIPVRGARRLIRTAK